MHKKKRLDCLPFEEESLDFTHNGNIHKLKLKTLPVRDITKGFDNLKQGVCIGGSITFKHLLDISVKILLNDETPEDNLDCLDIAATLITVLAAVFFTTVFWTIFGYSLNVPVWKKSRMNPRKISYSCL